MYTKYIWEFHVHKIHLGIHPQHVYLYTCITSLINYPIINSQIEKFSLKNRVVLKGKQTEVLIFSPHI